MKVVEENEKDRITRNMSIFSLTTQEVIKEEFMGMHDDGTEVVNGK